MDSIKRWLRNRKRRSWGPWIVSVLVGATVFWEVRQVVRARGTSLSSPRYLVAARDLSARTPLAFADLTIRHAGDQPVAPGTLTDQELHLLSDSLTTREVRAGDWITWSALASSGERGLAASVPKGLRAYHLDIEGAPAVFSRDRVDVHWSATGGTPPVTVLEAALVLGVKREGTRQGLDLAVSEDDVSALEKARGAGRLGLSLRNPEDSRRGRRRISRPTFKRRIDVWTDRA